MQGAIPQRGATSVGARMRAPYRVRLVRAGDKCENGKPYSPSLNIRERIFFSPSEPRLRAGWRLLIQAILQIVLTAIAGLIIFIPYSLFTGTPD